MPCAPLPISCIFLYLLLNDPCNGLLLVFTISKQDLIAPNISSFFK